MPFTPTTIPRATDWGCVVDDARASLIANATVASILQITASPTDPNGGRIAVGGVAEGVTAPYVVLGLQYVYESTYDTPTINGLLDVSAYTEGWSTTTVRALITACLSALIEPNTPWVTTSMTAHGVTLLSANMEESGTGGRDADDVVSGMMIRGRQDTIRVRAGKL